MKKFFVFCFCIFLFLHHFCVAEELSVQKENDVSQQEKAPKNISDKTESKKPQKTLAEKEKTESKTLITPTSQNDLDTKEKQENLKEGDENKKEEPVNDAHSPKNNTQPKKETNDSALCTKKDTLKNTTTTTSKTKKEDDKKEKKKSFSLRINEILPNPYGSDSGKEFIEIYNFGDTEISLKNWKLYDKTKKPYIFDDISIKSKGFLTLYNKKNFSFSLNNSNEEIFLETDTDDIISHYAYKKSTSGLSWNYDENAWYTEIPTPNTVNTENPLTKDYPEIIINEIFPNPKDNEEKNEFIELYNPNDKNISLKNWLLKDASQSGKYLIDDVVIPAKGFYTVYRTEFRFALNNSGNETISLVAPNTKTLSSISYTSSRENKSLNYAKDKWYWEKPTPNTQNYENPLLKTYPQLFLSEILPNPSGDENISEFIEIYNPHNHPINLEGWTLKDASSTGSYTFTHTHTIDAEKYFVIYRKDFSFALNNSNETLSLIAPNEKVMSTFAYQSSKEDVSHNYDDTTKSWRMSKNITPGEKNIFNNLPEITKYTIDKNVYKNVYAQFKAQSTDKDGEKLKVRWEFGDGRKSYLWNTRHKYAHTGTYHGTLRIQDKSEEIIKHFTVTVKKYPRHHIKITKVVPNPAGKDSGNEYIVIKNTTKKKINLKNWSIATGTKSQKLINHPISKNLYIKPGKTKTIKRKHAAISLPNKKGIIEIRRPDGSVSHTKKYGDKNISIPDNASYEKINGQWQWIIPINTKEQKIITQALANEKMFSQQRLEREIAYNAIYNPKEKPQFNETHSPNASQSLLTKINFLINHIILYTQNSVHQFLTNNTKKEIHGKIHPIKTSKNPCQNLHIPTRKDYTFCKEK